MKQLNLFELFLIFLKIGALLLGGGYVIVPILQEELVRKRQLVSKEEVVDFYALSQSLPGIIAVNTCLFVGYKLKGRLGAVISLLGLMTAPFFTIIALSGVLSLTQNIELLKYAFWGINIAIVILVFLSAQELLPCSIVDNFTKGVFVFVFLFTIFGVSPVYSMVLAILSAIFYKSIRRNI